MKSDVSPAFDNSDILSPSSALLAMTDRVMSELTKRDVVFDLTKSHKNGELEASVPQNFKATQLRNVYQRMLRMLTFKEAGAPTTQNIREEFETAMVTAYRNKSYHVFYIDAAYRTFFENLTLKIHTSAIMYELAAAGYSTNERSSRWAYMQAFDNVLRFNPLYVAYLYGVNGDIERQDLLIKEVADLLAWFQKDKA